MTKLELLMAHAKGRYIVHPKTDDKYRMGSLIEVKMNGEWVECMQYYLNRKNGQSLAFCRALDDFKKFTVFEPEL